MTCQNCGAGMTGNFPPDDPGGSTFWRCPKCGEGMTAKYVEEMEEREREEEEKAKSASPK